MVHNIKVSKEQMLHLPCVYLYWSYFALPVVEHCYIRASFFGSVIVSFGSMHSGTHLPAPDLHPVHEQELPGEEAAQVHLREGQHGQPRCSCTARKEAVAQRTRIEGGAWCTLR